MTRCVRCLGLVLALLAGLGNRALAHDFYHDWKIPGPDGKPTGSSCCNNKDCRQVKSQMDEGGNWWVEIDKQWVPVPKSAILPHTAPDGKAHLCASTQTIFCFVTPVDEI